MNYLKIAGVMFAASLTSQVSAETYQFVAENNSAETKLCVSIANNDLDTMRYKLFMMGQGEQVRRNINTLKCNDLSLAKFAYKYNAATTFTYLNERSAPVNRATTKVTINDISKTDKADKPILVYVSAP